MLTALVFASCEKSDEVVYKTNNLNNDQNILKSSESSWGLHRKFWELQGDCMCIDRTPYDCYDDIVIKPSYIILKDFISLVKAGNNSDIIEYVKKNFEELKAYFDSDLLTAVINGNVILTYKENTSLKTEFILFVDSATNALKVVYPFVS